MERKHDDCHFTTGKIVETLAQHSATIADHRITEAYSLNVKLTPP